MSFDRKNLTGFFAESIQKALDKVNFAKDLNLPENYQIGEAVDNGGCFFDSMAQWLNLLLQTNIHTEKSLRMDCYNFYKQNKVKVDKWNQEDNYRGNYDNIQFTEVELSESGRTSLWGRPMVEGRILCDRYDLEAIHAIDMIINPEKKGTYIPCHTLYKKDGSIMELDENYIEYKDNIPILLAMQEKLHFIPVLPSKNILTNTDEMNLLDEDLNQFESPSANAVTRLKQFNQNYLLEKNKINTRVFSESWCPGFFEFIGWKNTLEWQSRATELRNYAFEYLLDQLKELDDEDKEQLIKHIVSLSLPVFNDHRSNYLRFTEDTRTTGKIKYLQKSVEDHKQHPEKPIEDEYHIFKRIK